MLQRKISLRLICILVMFLGTVFAYGQEKEGATGTLIVFYSPGCHKCAQIKSELMPEIEREFKGQVQIDYCDTSDIENYSLMLGLKEKYAKDIALVLPVFYLKGRFLNGNNVNKDSLRSLIAGSLAKAHKERFLPRINLLDHFQAFTPLVIISAGLIDGFNPCAFTVIVFFISFLSLQGYKKKEVAVVGLSFIFAVFLTYILVGLGLFEFLYRWQRFWLAAKAVNIAVGIFSIVLGVLACYDFFKFKKTGKTEELALQLAPAIKNRIHYLIGLHYRKADKTAGHQKHVFRLILSALISGFLVSLLEAVCTGQTYLPVIAFILKTASLQLAAFGYLLLYNLMFIVPLVIILLFALLGATSEEFSGFLKKRLLTLKLLMAALFFALGIFLIWRA